MSSSPITNYTTLKAAITDYLVRSGDSDFTGSVDAFIPLAEASFNRKILSRRAETSASLTTAADGSVALPADYLAMRSSATNYGSYLTPLTSLSQGSIAWSHSVNTGGDPYDLTIINGTIYVNPPAVRTLVFDYYAKFVGLSGSNATNWVITNHPDYYLNACLEQGCRYLQDWPNMGIYGGLKQQAEDEIMALYDVESYFNAGMQLQGTVP